VTVSIIQIIVLALRRVCDRALVWVPNPCHNANFTVKRSRHSSILCSAPSTFLTDLIRKGESRAWRASWLFRTRGSHEPKGYHMPTLCMRPVFTLAFTAACSSNVFKKWTRLGAARQTKSPPSIGHTAEDIRSVARCGFLHRRKTREATPISFEYGSK
jgi:hypothetical protein